MKLHLGCGTNIKESWENLDARDLPGATKWNAPTLPHPDESVDFIYSEHFIEHISKYDCCQLFYEAYRVLKPGGTMRISTPDLQTIRNEYLKTSWSTVRKKYANAGLLYDSPANFINSAFRDWEHLYIYDHEELETIARVTGFKETYSCKFMESPITELKNLETRPDLGDLILEFKK